MLGEEEREAAGESKGVREGRKRIVTGHGR